jgi:hypothetical protein
VSAHSVGDHVQVAALPPALDLRGADDGVAILIIGATHAGVGRGGVDDDVVPVHDPALYPCSSRSTPPTHEAVALRRSNSPARLARTYSLRPEDPPAHSDERTSVSFPIALADKDGIIRPLYRDATLRKEKIRRDGMVRVPDWMVTANINGWAPLPVGMDLYLRYGEFVTTDPFFSPWKCPDR